MSLSESTFSRVALLVAVVLIVIGFVTTRDNMVPATERWFRYSGFGPFASLPGVLVLGYVLSRDSNRLTRRRLLVGAVVGFLGGASLFFPTISLFRELAKRWLWARSGGGGESAVWGEPLTYIIFGSVPIGLLGAIVGMSLVAAILWARGQAFGAEKLDDNDKS